MLKTDKEQVKGQEFLGKRVMDMYIREVDATVEGKSLTNNTQIATGLTWRG